MPINHQRLKLKFSSEKLVTATLHENVVASTFHENEKISTRFEQEACLVLDVALASGGCEAKGEGFYSVVKPHPRSGGQSNKV